MGASWELAQVGEILNSVGNGSRSRGKENDPMSSLQQSLQRSSVVPDVPVVPVATVAVPP